MVFELTTYSFKPRTVPLAEASFAEASVERCRHSELLGAFRTEIGPLNQVLHLWKYRSLAEREQVALKVAGDGNWPPQVGEWLVGLRTEILRPVSISPELRPGKLGPFYELRTYTYPLGGLDKMMQAWDRAMPMRNALGSPVAAIWANEIGALNTLTHLWPYPSMEEREAIRKQVRVSGKWPPYLLDIAEGGQGYETISQENKLMLPLVYSPLQ